MALLILPMAVAMFVAAPLGLGLFGEVYAREGTPLLRWLMLATPAIIVNVWYLSYARVLGDVKAIILIQGLLCVLTLGLSNWWLPTFGITSVGVAWVISQTSVAVLIAVSSVTFIIALTYTTVANVLFMQAVAPIAAALIAWVALRESVSRQTIVAMVVALIGVGLMVGGPGGAHGIGLALSVVMMLTFALGLVITSHRRDVSMGPAMCLSQVLVLAVVGPFAHPATISAHDLVLMMLLGFGQMTLGLGFLMKGGRLLPAAEVALISLLEVVLAPLWVWLSISEQPSAATLAGGAVVVAAVVIQARAGPGTT